MNTLAHPSTVLRVLEEAEKHKAMYRAYVNDPHGDLDEYTLGSMEAQDAIARQELSDLITVVLGVDASRIVGVLA